MIIELSLVIFVFTLCKLPRMKITGILKAKTVRIFRNSSAPEFCLGPIMRS